MKKILFSLLIILLSVSLIQAQTKIRSVQLADSIHIQKTDFDDCVIDTLTITDSLSIISGEAIPFIIGTATDNVRFQIDTTGTGKSDNDWIVTDSLKAEELYILTIESTPFAIGTATDATRTSIDSTGTLVLDNDASIADSLKCEEINIITVESTPFNLGTATDGTRASVDSAGTLTLDKNLYVADSIKTEEINILTVEATPFNLGTATDGTRASLDSTGTLTLDNDLSVTDDASIGDSLKVEELNILSVDPTPLVVGTATDASRALIDSSGNIASDGYVIADSFHVRNTIVIKSSKSSPFLLGTATDGTRTSIDSTGSMTLDNDLAVADSIKTEEINILTVELTPFVIGTASDASRASIDSSGNISADGSFTIGDISADSLTLNEIRFLSTEDTCFLIGTASDVMRAMIDTTGNIKADGNLTIQDISADSIYATEVNLITTEDSTFVIGTATDKQRAIIDSTGSLILDNDLRCDSIYAHEINFITTEDTTLVIGTATDAQRCIIDSSGNIIADGNITVRGDSVVTWADTTSSIGTNYKTSLVHYGFGSMSMYESANTLTIDAVSQYHLVDDANMNTGLVEGWTFADGKTGTVTVFVARGANLSCFSAGHNLATGDIVSLTGSDIEVGDADHYVGVYSVTVVHADTFVVAHTFNATQTATWRMGAYLKAGVGTDGVYSVDFHITGASADASANRYRFEIFRSETKSSLSVGEFTTILSEICSTSGDGLLNIVAGDRIILGIENLTDGDDFSYEHINIIATRH